MEIVERFVPEKGTVRYKFNNLVIRYCLYQVTGKQNNLFCNKYNSLPNLKLDHVSLRSNLDYYGLANTVTYCLESHNCVVI